MYRGKISEKDVIIRLGRRAKLHHIDSDKIYRMVLSYGEIAFEKGQDMFCIYHDRIGFIVAEVEKNDVPVIRVDYVIDQQNVYE
ncbi:hypothetical protein [Thermaerobacillus caldiproteolyticus]|uniref:DUF4258 domain-containing protein n=1 Tax=Thermaerobacillus caldiproteolyticus TaxID=247480 RepID=A0A7V9Z982_9BACL|nr:hypothetical protein [Anoxybacillus caldiproteolyticus]MBA2876408.1 hypothetical protein [Anoxybacillus caldiproteolyticus]